MNRARNAIKKIVIRITRFIEDVIGEEIQSMNHFYRQFA